MLKLAENCGEKQIRAPKGTNTFLPKLLISTELSGSAPARGLLCLFLNSTSYAYDWYQIDNTDRCSLYATNKSLVILTIQKLLVNSESRVFYQKVSN
jgi:hypothetical protein